MKERNGMNIEGTQKKYGLRNLYSQETQNEKEKYSSELACMCKQEKTHLNKREI